MKPEKPGSDQMERMEPEKESEKPGTERMKPENRRMDPMDPMEPKIRHKTPYPLESPMDGIA